MTGTPGRPKGSRSQKLPHLTLRSQSAREKAGSMHAPIPAIEDDYRAVKKDIKHKMSEVTLKYLRYKNYISGVQFIIYKNVANFPEDRKVITEHNIVEHINLKLIELYESV